MSLLRIERRDRSRFVGLALVGSLLVGAAILHPTSAAEVDPISVVLGTAGLIAVFMGVPNAIAANLHVRRAEGLRRGRKVVARWSVSPAAWARFVKLDGEDTREGRLWPNQLAASPEPASKAVEVIVGENAILVGDDSHLLFDGGRGARVEVIPGDPLRLNVITVVDEPVGPETEASYRLPVGVGCSAEVGAVRAYFARAEP
jgi:hypothetical protein